MVVTFSYLGIEVMSLESLETWDQTRPEDTFGR